MKQRALTWLVLVVLGLVLWFDRLLVVQSLVLLAQILARLPEKP